MTEGTKAVARVVVGIDDSEGSRRALEWALDEAAARGAGLEVVHVWSVPYAYAPIGMGVIAVDPAEYEAAAKQLLERMVDEAVARRPGVDVRRVLAEGTPAHVLLERASDADLVVVGSRGRGGFAGLLLGSVSQQVAHHARCPIVIVREEG